jgi:hypothetical protein
MNFSNQGTLSGTTAVHTAPDNNRSEVNSLRFTNAAAFVLTLQKYTSATAATTVIYSLTLSAGDILTDDNSYHLDQNDRLEAISSVAGTTFIVEGENLPNINVVRCK